MKILLIGSGGREHALAWAISGSALTESLVIAPGNDAMATLGRCAGVPADDLDGLRALAEAERPDLVVVGPEAPLVAGLVDKLEAAGFPAFGPSAAAAQLEGSKAFARQACARFGIHQPGFTVCTDIGSARAAIAASGGACVIKADGLAAGKGVVVADTAAEAEDDAIFDSGPYLDRSRYEMARLAVETVTALPESDIAEVAITPGFDLGMVELQRDGSMVVLGDTVVGDRHLDLARAAVALALRFGPAVVAPFLDAYGLDDIDVRRLDTCQLLGSVAEEVGVAEPVDAP